MCHKESRWHTANTRQYKINFAPKVKIGTNLRRNGCKLRRPGGYEQENASPRNNNVTRSIIVRSPKQPPDGVFDRRFDADQFETLDDNAKVRTLRTHSLSEFLLKIGAKCAGNDASIRTCRLSGAQQRVIRSASLCDAAHNCIVINVLLRIEGG